MMTDGQVEAMRRGRPRCSAVPPSAATAHGLGRPSEKVGRAHEKTPSALSGRGCNERRQLGGWGASAKSARARGRPVVNCLARGSRGFHNSHYQNGFRHF
jgi:hypothetical protein